MISAIRKYMPRWLMAIIATALVLATLVGSSQDSAEAIDPADTDTVYIADGTNFADALMGATIASLNTSPMLGVAGTHSGDTIPGDTVEELDRLTNNKTDLLDTIYIFGGNQAVSDSVASQLGDWANDVQRIQGDSRWGTYEAISQMLPSAIDEAVHAQEADNADTLDGQDSTDFLGATEQAVDSDKLDGLDSLELTPFATASGADFTTTSSTSFEDLAGATVEITVPAGHEAVILTRFTAESACYGDTGWCPVRILVDGTEAEPAEAGNVAFDSSDGNNETVASWESHAIERTAGPLPAGTYTVTVQQMVTQPGLTLRLDDWLLVAEAKLTS